MKRRLIWKSNVRRDGECETTRLFQKTRDDFILEVDYRTTVRGSYEKIARQLGKGVMQALTYQGILKM